MRSRLALLAVMFTSLSALALACNDENPPPAVPTTPPAPVTTVVIDAGAGSDPAPVASAASVDAGPPAVAADPPDAAPAAPTTSASGPDFFACSAAADCVAIPKNDCCHNGYKEAVNKNEVDAYKASAPKCNPKRKCPMFRIMDKRVSDCNAGKCVLVQPSATP